MTETTIDEMLTLRDAAKRVGLAYSTLTSERTRGRFPKPDATVLGRALWLPETIDTHYANRPGPGRWGKRSATA